ncbi:MAG: protein kinase [Chloroflexi bacterium]|nr:protein kinase [Chloroflexota bacterium]
MLNPERLVDTKINQYHIQAHIDRGGMADVYLALDENLQRRVALKIMLPAFAHDEQFVERFWREARTAARLDHPNIVRVYEIGNTPGERPYIAMQYIDGGSLKDKLVSLDGRPMLVDDALTVIRQIAIALGVAHDAQIVHRDIKPSNVLLRPDGSPILVDLGIAAVQTGQKLTQTGTLIGTPHYMSPEQVSGSGIDGRSDIYSLGVVLYELLCGSRPFEADDSLAILHKHVYETPQPLPERRAGLTQQTYRLVDICLQKDPDQRYQTAAEFAAAIDRALDAERAGQAVTPVGRQTPVSDPTVPMRYEPPPPKTTKQRPRWLWALIPILLLLIGGGTYLAFSGRDDAAATPTPPSPTAAPPTPTLQIIAAATDASAPPTEPPPAAAIPTDTPPPPPTNTSLPPTETSAPTETPDLGPETMEIGRSVQNRVIEAVRFGAGEHSIIMIGGLHAGAAPSSVTVAQRAISYFTNNPQLIPAGATLYVIPSVSSDSPLAPGELRGRLNANGVDLNRNWDCRWAEDAEWRGEVVKGSGGPFPFSEPETQAMRDFIQEVNAAAVIFWEARAVDGLSSPGACGDRTLVSGRLAQIYGLAAGYPIADFENLTDQILNGDSTNWLDLQGIPAIAVLLPDYDDDDWNNNLAGMLAVLDEYSR